jgi:serine/threonine kinase 32
MFALKYIDKAHCSKQRAVANVIQERRLLEEVRVHCLGSEFGS